MIFCKGGITERKVMIDCEEGINVRAFWQNYIGVIKGLIELVAGGLS